MKPLFKVSTLGENLAVYNKPHVERDSRRLNAVQEFMRNSGAFESKQDSNGVEVSCFGN